MMKNQAFKGHAIRAVVTYSRASFCCTRLRKIKDRWVSSNWLFVSVLYFFFLFKKVRVAICRSMIVHGGPLQVCIFPIVEFFSFPLILLLSTDWKYKCRSSLSYHTLEVPSLCFRKHQPFQTIYSSFRISRTKLHLWCSRCSSYSILALKKWGWSRRSPGLLSSSMATRCRRPWPCRAFKVSKSRSRTRCLLHMQRSREREF